MPVSKVPNAEPDVSILKKLVLSFVLKFYAIHVKHIEKSSVRVFFAMVNRSELMKIT